MTKQILTYDEQQVVTLAHLLDQPNVMLEVKGPNGNWFASFCGRCGRIIHHPDCPQGLAPSDDHR